MEVKVWRKTVVKMEDNRVLRRAPRVESDKTWV